MVYSTLILSYSCYNLRAHTLWSVLRIFKKMLLIPKVCVRKTEEEQTGWRKHPSGHKKFCPLHSLCYVCLWNPQMLWKSRLVCAATSHSCEIMSHEWSSSNWTELGHQSVDSAASKRIRQNTTSSIKSLAGLWVNTHHKCAIRFTKSISCGLTL